MKNTSEEVILVVSMPFPEFCQEAEFSLQNTSKFYQEAFESNRSKFSQFSFAATQTEVCKLYESRHYKVSNFQYSLK